MKRILYLLLPILFLNLSLNSCAALKDQKQVKNDDFSANSIF